MVIERFPKRRYLRTLRDMQDEFEAWRFRYQQDSSWQEDLAAAARLDRRTAMLQDAVALLRRTFDIVEELPRLS